MIVLVLFIINRFTIALTLVKIKRHMLDIQILLSLLKTTQTNKCLESLFVLGHLLYVVSLLFFVQQRRNLSKNKFKMKELNQGIINTGNRK